MEIGIEPTVRHGADLGYIPVVVTDACGAGNEEVGQRAPASIDYIGDAFRTDAAKVGGKMLALSRLSGRPLQLSVKCDPDLGAQLRATYEAIVPGYHLDKRHWLTISVTEVPDELVRELVAGSYELVVVALRRNTRGTLRA
jgi:predicted DNA-binding protein (MmcQ/YjbR family)